MALVLAVLAAINAYTNALQPCTSAVINSAFYGLNANSLYCCGAVGGSPCFSSSSYSCPSTKTINDKQFENTTVSLNCSTGFKISEITFASYGSPTGSPGSYSIASSCHSPTSKSYMTSQCVDKQSCTVLAVNDNFGDPCVGIGKYLAVTATCAAYSPSALGSSCTSKCSPVSSDIFRSSGTSSTEASCLKSSTNTCGDVLYGYQLALGKISPACYLSSTVSTSDAASYTTSVFVSFMQSWSGFPSTVSTTSPSTSSGSSATQKSSSSSSNTTTIIIIVVVVVVVILAAVLVFCYCRKKKSKSTDAPVESQFDVYETTYNLSQRTDRNGNHVQAQPQFNIYEPPVTQQPAPWCTDQYKNPGDRPTNSSDRSMGTGTLTNGSTNSQRMAGRRPDPNYAKINMHDLELHYIPPEHLYSISVIARGAYGEVLLGDYQGQTVAIKKLLGHRKDIQHLQKFIEEICLVAKLNSQFIVQFIGASWTTPADIVLVTEFMDAGDLRTVLDNNDSKLFTWQHKVSCAMDIAN
ncbi:hypothetical protein THRCLA_05717, partial [Thraustotheca clavata]